MKRYSYLYSTNIKYENAISRHTIRLRCQPAECHFQKTIEEHFSLSEGFWHQQSTDAMGSRVLQGGMRASHNSLSYVCSGIIEQTMAYVIPDEHPHGMYRLSSALTPFKEDMRTLLPENPSNDFLTHCLEIMHATHKWLSYVAGSTTLYTTAHDAFATRQGVCQDYAHLMVSLCRASGIMSRYVCGLMVGEGATHAWVECHDGHCWYAFDPTNDTAIAYGYIKIAHGRDASDCPVSRGSFKGITGQTTEIKVRMNPLVPLCGEVREDCTHF